MKLKRKVTNLLVSQIGWKAKPKKVKVLSAKINKLSRFYLEYFEDILLRRNPPELYW